MIDKIPVKFRGKQYFLIGSIKSGGPLVDPALFDETKNEEHNDKSVYAFLFTNGIIRRFGKRIGKVSDLEFYGRSET